MGRDTHNHLDVVTRQHVSIHAPAWGATVSGIADRTAAVLFQSTRPRGARRSHADIRRAARAFQSTRPRGARPSLTLGGNRPIRVSIHAPAWGATREAWYAGVKRAKFQSTRPRGARRHVVIPAGARGTVSIHAPAWGATILFHFSSSSDVFQSTRPRGARPCSCLVRAYWSWFQSTRPRGARPNRGALFTNDRRVSIHAPAWGATYPFESRPDTATVSIHAPAWGATSLRTGPSNEIKVSIHAPAWGATRVRGMGQRQC